MARNEEACGRQKWELKQVGRVMRKVKARWGWFFFFCKRRGADAIKQWQYQQHRWTHCYLSRSSVSNIETWCVSLRLWSFFWAWLTGLDQYSWLLTHCNVMDLWRRGGIWAKHFSIHRFVTVRPHLKNAVCLTTPWSIPLWCKGPIFFSLSFSIYWNIFPNCRLFTC